MEQNDMPDMRRLDLRSTAFHEAGHAVSAHFHGIDYSRVWILRREDGAPVPKNTPLGQLTRTQPVQKNEFSGELELAKTEAIQALVGPIAECLAHPGFQPDWQLNCGDLNDARSFLRFAIVPFRIENGKATFTNADHNQAIPELDRILNECLQASLKFVNSQSAQIACVAEALLSRWELTKQDVNDLLT